MEKITKYFAKMYYIGLICLFIVYKLHLINVISMTVCKAVFAMSFFAMKKTKKNLFITLFSSVVFFLIGERTSAIIFIIIYLFNLIIKKINKEKTYKLFFIVCSILLIMIPKIYVWIQYQPLGRTLNEYSRKISGENFFSGRNRIWGAIYESLGENEIFGLSYNNDILKSKNINISTHNLYIWLQMNGGYILLVLFLIFLYSIWIKFYKQKENEEIRLSASYLLGFMVLVSFELLWLSNNFVVSIYMWFVMGCGLINVKRLEE